MTYYTIAYKSDGSCCEECQPDPSTCSCEEDVCCDPDASYADKTATLVWHRVYGSGGGNYDELVQFTGIWSGGGQFNGSWTRDYRVCGRASDTGCYEGVVGCDPYTYTAGSAALYVSCETDVNGTFYYFYLSFFDLWSDGFRTESLLPNCGLMTGCNMFNQLWTCTATYSSSCYSISTSRERCYLEYLLPSCVSQFRGNWEQTDITMSIA